LRLGFGDKVACGPRLRPNRVARKARKQRPLLALHVECKEVIEAHHAFFGLARVEVSTEEECDVRAMGANAHAVAASSARCGTTVLTAQRELAPGVLSGSIRMKTPEVTVVVEAILTRRAQFTTEEVAATERVSVLVRDELVPAAWVGSALAGGELAPGCM